MSFRILVDGEEKASVDEQVTRVTLMTSRGAAAVVGIADEGAIDIIIEKVVPGGPMRLDHQEALNRRLNAERVEGEVSGQTNFEVSKALTGTQGEHVSTVTGKPDGATSTPSVVPPSRDLTEGLEADDTATLDARLAAFGESGDADAAIKDNPAGSGAESAEESPTDDSNDDTLVLS